MNDTSKDKIDITMTAVLRPSILAETLSKIKTHVCKGEEDRYRLIINVDPIGEDVEAGKIIKVVTKNFQNVVYNIAETPSFPKAVKWVWSKVEAPYVFHWEDDVNILYDIDVDVMIQILKDNMKLSSLRLYKRNTPNSSIIKDFECKWIYKENEKYYIADDWKKQFGLNPILIKNEFIKEAVSRMVDDVNPEKQFRYSQEYMRPLIRKWKYGLFTYPGAPRMIDGRKGQRWKNKLRLKKPPAPETFIVWNR